MNGHRSVLTHLTHGSNSESSLTHEPEAVFALTGVRAIRLASHHRNTSVEDFFAHQVARQPKDLLSHVQRINLFLQQQDGSRAYGALLDLFIVLGEKGVELRRRMLALAEPLLSESQRNALAERLKIGLSALDAVPIAPESVLSKGIRGSTRLVHRPGEGAAEYLDPLEEARSCLEYGQVDQARSLLEEAVLREPWRSELQGDLLEIYRRARDEVGFGAMFKMLEEAGISLSEQWHETAHFFFGISFED